MSQPIACTLTPGAFRDRTRETERLAADALLGREPLSGGVRLTFKNQSGVARRLRTLIAAEAQCCSFMHMELRDAGGQLELDVTGPQDAQLVIEQLFAH